MNKAALFGLLRSGAGTAAAATVAKPAMANRFMTRAGWKASRGTGVVGAGKRVGSEVADALLPSGSLKGFFRPGLDPKNSFWRPGVGDAIGVGMQGMQAAGKAQEYNQMLRPKTILASEVLRSHLKKTATVPSDIGSNMINALMIGAGLAAAGVGVGAAANGVGSMFTKLQSGRMFDELRRTHPEIKSNPKARQYFDLIVAYAPSLMRHPSAIGDFLMRQLQYPMSSVEFIKQLADLEATVSKTSRESAGSEFGRSMTQFAGNPVGAQLKPPRR